MLALLLFRTDTKNEIKGYPTDTNVKNQEMCTECYNTIFLHHIITCTGINVTEKIMYKKCVEILNQYHHEKAIVHGEHQASSFSILPPDLPNNFKEKVYIITLKFTKLES